MVGLFVSQKEAQLKNPSLFLIAILTLALIASNLPFDHAQDKPFAPLDRSTPPAPLEAQNAAPQNPIVRVDPAESEVRAGDTFTVTVMTDDASDLGGFEFDLFFITTTVTVDSVVVGDFPGRTERIVVPVVPDIDNQAGWGSFATATAGDVPGSDGTGVLAIITLTAQEPGESPLNLQDVQVLDTRVELKTPIVENGMVRVRLVAIYLPLVMKDR